MFEVDLSVLSIPNVGEWQTGVQAAVVQMLPAIGAALVEHVDNRFATSTDPWGVPWVGLAESTLEARARKAAGPTRVRNTTVGPLREGQKRTRTRRWTRARSERAAAAVFNAKPLIDTGTLRASIHSYIEPGPNGDAIVKVAVGGPSAAYAAVHQWGSEDGTIPARPFLPLRGTPSDPTVVLSAEVTDEIVAMLQQAVDRFVQYANTSSAPAALPATGTGG